MTPELVKLIIEAIDDGEELPPDDLKLLDMWLMEKARGNFFASAG